ncbi:MAG: hypothetical protein L6Q57_08360 [Alphaproteobacteria bacterium]|nr:hypothetical protein [Alphaproteobacteria bacterium]
MSAYIGHKLSFADAASKPEDCKEVFALAANSLEHRALGHKRMDAVSEAASRKAEASSLLPLWIEERRLHKEGEARAEDKRFATSYAGMTAPIPGFAEIYVPRTGFISASPWHMFAFERPLPVQISSQHVERRYLERSESRRTLQYADNPFMTTLGISLLLCEIFQKSNDPSILHGKPLLLPHPEGFFLGRFVAAAPDELTHSLRVSAVNSREVPAFKNATTLLKRERDLIEARLQEAASTVRIAHENQDDIPHHLKIEFFTFIGHDNMFLEQKALHTYFRDLIDDDFSGSVRCVIEAYLIGSYEKANRLFSLVEADVHKRIEETHKLDSIRGKLSKITQHLSWTVSTNQLAQDTPKWRANDLRIA